MKNLLARVRTQSSHFPILPCHLICIKYKFYISNTDSNISISLVALGQKKLHPNDNDKNTGQDGYVPTQIFEHSGEKRLPLDQIWIGCFDSLTYINTTGIRKAYSFMDMSSVHNDT